MANDNGLVDEYAKLKKLSEEIDKKIEEIKEKIIALSKEKYTDVLFGSYKKCLIKEYERVIYPEDKTILIEKIKSKGLYDQFSSINYFKLNPKILKHEIDNEILALVKKEKAFRLFLKDIG